MHITHVVELISNNESNTAQEFVDHEHRGADKSLARPGRKQARAIEDFDVHISYLLS